MRNSRPDILSRPLFILAVGLLLLNDFYLKYEFSNFVTGKISDVAGLFLFPYFLSSFRTKHAKAIYIGTAALFVFWKSPLSQELINLAQTIGIGFNRVVDYTDIFALFILTLSFCYFQRQISTERKISKYLKIPIGILSLFAIWATTLPREKVDLNLTVNTEYELKISKAEFFKLIEPGHGYSDTLEKNLSDSLFYLHFDISNGRIDVTAVATITAIDSKTTRVNLDRIEHGYITGSLFSGVDKDDIDDFKSISVEEFESRFEYGFIKPIENRRPEYIYYDNKEIHDAYQNE